MKFIVKNKDKEPRKFYDTQLGRYVILAHKEEAITSSPPEPKNIFSITEKKEETTKKTRKEVK